MNYKNVVLWAVTIFVGLTFVMAGVGKFANAAFWHAQFTEHWGLPAWLINATGAAEIVGGFMILMPSLAVYGAGLIVAVMIGATGAHLMAGELQRIGITILLGGLAAFVANYRKSQRTDS